MKYSHDRKIEFIDEERERHFVWLLFANPDFLRPAINLAVVSQ